MPKSTRKHITQAMLSEQEVRGLVGNLMENGKLGCQEVELIAELVAEGILLRDFHCMLA